MASATTEPAPAPPPIMISTPDSDLLFPAETIPTSPSNASALAYIPAEFIPDPDAPNPTLLAIHPWDLTTPIPICAEPPIFYDAFAQEYYLFTDSGALLIHKTPQVGISKKQARRYLYDFPDQNEAVTLFNEELKIPKSSTPLLSDRDVIYHAVHDSIIVKRNTGNTSLFCFCVDKAMQDPNSGVIFHEGFMAFLRPGFNHLRGHVCEEVEYYGDIIYCRACPSYRTALPVSSSPTTSEPQIDPATCLTKHTVTTTAPRFLGRIIMPIIVSRHLLAKCLEPGTTNFNIARAYKVLGECFNMLDLRSIKVPQADMVANLVRDSLFVDVSAGIGGQGTQRVDGARQIASWGRFFNISESDVPRDQGFTCGRGRGSISGKGAGSGSGTVATAKGSVGVAVGAGIASVASLISG